jgi:hypothetical protein
MSEHVQTLKQVRAQTTPRVISSGDLFDFQFEGEIVMQVAAVHIAKALK